MGFSESPASPPLSIDWEVLVGDVDCENWMGSQTHFSIIEVLTTLSAMANDLCEFWHYLVTFMKRLDFPHCILQF